MSLSRSLPCRTALLLTLAAAWLCPPQAEARLLWRGKKKAPQSVSPETTPAARTNAGSAGSSTFDRAATLLGAPADGAAPGQPEELTRLSHELQRLRTAASALAAAESDEELALENLRYGNALAQLGYDAHAALAYQAAVRLDPTLLAGRLNMGALMRRAGRLREARDLLEDVLQDSPNSALGWFNLALTEDSLQHHDESDAAYLEALRLDPSLWLPSKNPLIVGNQRAKTAIHRSYLQRQGGDKILLEGGP